MEVVASLYPRQVARPLFISNDATVEVTDLLTASTASAPSPSFGPVTTQRVWLDRTG